MVGKVCLSKRVYFLYNSTFLTGTNPQPPVTTPYVPLHTSTPTQPPMNEQAVKTFMHNFGMSTAALAEFVGIPTTLLNNKLNPAYRNKLTQEERATISRYFNLLHLRLGEFLATGLEDARTGHSGAETATETPAS